MIASWCVGNLSALLSRMYCDVTTYTVLYTPSSLPARRRRSRRDVYFQAQKSTLRNPDALYEFGIRDGICTDWKELFFTTGSVAAQKYSGVRFRSPPYGFDTTSDSDKRI